MCKICYKFPKINIVDNDNIQLICDNESCKSFNKPTKIKDAYKRLIELKDNNYDIFGCDEPDHNGEKFIYYCKDCKDNKCGQCGKICEEKKHSLEDLNRDMITKKKRDFVKSKCDKRNEYFKECKIKEIKNFENNYIEDALFEQSFKIIKKDENTCNVAKDNSYVDAINEIKEKSLLNLIDIIIFDYDNFPNYRHRENISYLEKYMNYQYGNKDGKKLNTFNLEYKLTDGNKIQLFGYKFIENNKDNCFLVINNKYFDLSSYIYYKDIFVDKKEEIIKVELIERENRVISDMRSMFEGISSLLSTSDFSNFDFSNVINMSEMFYNCITLKSLPNISNWNVSKVRNMSCMFKNCFLLESLPEGISDWNTSNVTDMSYLFNNCKALKFLPDISKWNTSKVTTITSIFSKCSTLKKIPDISKWNTNNIEYMNKIFDECISLESLPEIKCWNFDKVNNMEDILEGSPINFPLIQTKDKWEKIKEKLYSFLIIVKDFILSAYINFVPLFILIIFFALLLLYFCFNSLFLPFKLIYFGLKTYKEEFHFNFQILYDFFTLINGGKEFNSEKIKIAILNIIFVFIMIINSLYLIYEKIYDKLKSKYFLIISLTLNWISLIILIINLYTLNELNNSFAIYRQNVNDRFHYTYNNTYDTNNYTDNNSYADTYNDTNYDINGTDNADNDVDYETKIISKNEYFNLGNLDSEIIYSWYLIFFCTIFFIFIITIYDSKKSNEKAKILNKGNDKYTKSSKNLDKPKIDEIFDNEFENDNDNDNDNNNGNENENGVSLINIRDEYSLNEIN